MVKRSVSANLLERIWLCNYSTHVQKYLIEQKINDNLFSIKLIFVMDEFKVTERQCYYHENLN